MESIARIRMQFVRHHAVVVKITLSFIMKYPVITLSFVIKLPFITLSFIMKYPVITLSFSKVNIK